MDENIHEYDAVKLKPAPVITIDVPPALLAWEGSNLAQMAVTLNNSVAKLKIALDSCSRETVDLHG